MKKVVSKSQTGFFLDVDVKEKLIELSSRLGKSMTKIVSDMIEIKHSRPSSPIAFEGRFKGNRVLRINISDPDYESLVDFLELALGFTSVSDDDVRNQLEEVIVNHCRYAGIEARSMKELNKSMKIKEKTSS